MIIGETERLIIREWRKSDYQPFYKMSADPEVMAFYPSTLTVQECDEWLLKVKKQVDKNGYCFWALELKESGEFVGFSGLNIPGYELPFAACTEIGWRLAKEHWGKGYATEAAKRCIKYGFSELQLEDIFAFAVKDNDKSIAVMERIGMHDTGRNFEHPHAQLDHLKEHVLFQIESRKP